MPVELSESTVVARAPNAAFRELEGKTYLVGVASSAMVMLNETGTAIWKALEQPRSLAQLADQLAEEFEVTREAAAEDCFDFVRALVSRALLVIRPG